MTQTPHLYQATLRPVSFCTLPPDDEVQKGWTYAAMPGTPDGGMYGVISLPRPLTQDERDRFGLVPYGGRYDVEQSDEASGVWKRAGRFPTVNDAVNFQADLAIDHEGPGRLRTRIVDNETCEILR